MHVLCVIIAENCMRALSFIIAENYIRTLSVIIAKSICERHVWLMLKNYMRVLRVLCLFIAENCYACAMCHYC